MEGDDDDAGVAVDAGALVKLDPDLLKWARLRVGGYVTSEILRPGRFYRRWDIRKLLYNVTQRLDYSTQSCLYLAVSSGRGSVGGRSGAASRAPSIVGFNRNPVDATAARNARRTGDATNAWPVWTLLAYVVIGKRQFERDMLRKLAARVTAIKGIEAKMLELLQFAVRTDSPLRIDACVFDADSRWYMPTIQKYMAGHEHFIAYALSLRERERDANTRPPARQTTETPPRECYAHGQEACAASPAFARDRPQTPESRPALQTLCCSV